MKKEELFNIIGEVDEQKVASAGMAMKKTRKPVWTKWAAMAACLCLVVAGAFVAPTLIGEQNVEQPMGQGFFNAAVVEIEDDKVVVECTESLQGEIPVGSKVQISTDTISSETVPELAVGDNVRVLYLGKVTESDLLILENTISIFLLDEKGEPIVQPTESNSPTIQYPSVQEYVMGQGNIKGNVPVSEYTSISEDFAIGADKDGYAVFKDPNKAFTKLTELYVDGINLIQTEFDLEPLTEQNYEWYKTYGAQVTAGTPEQQEQARFVGKFLDIYENSFSKD